MQDHKVIGQSRVSELIAHNVHIHADTHTRSDNKERRGLFISYSVLVTLFGSTGAREPPDEALLIIGA